MRGRNILASAAVVPLVIGLATQACAQETETRQEEAAGLADIVVTAQYRAQNVQQTPLAITAVNAELLEARSQTNVIDVAAQAPNVTLRAGGGQGGTMSATIRGVGQTDYSLALEPGVGIYIDDVYLATMAGQLINLVDIDRIEVARGPQGTLSGKNSIGGSIKIYSKVPAGSNTGYVSATYGTDNRMTVRGAADFALAPDLFVRLSGIGHTVDGFVDRIDYRCSHPAAIDVPTAVRKGGGDCRLGTLGGQEYLVGSADILYRPSDVFELRFRGDYTKDSSEGQAVVQSVAQQPQNGLPGVPGYDSRFVTLGSYVNYSTYCSPTDGGYCIDPLSQSTGGGLSLQAKLDLSDSMSLTSITAWRKQKTLFSLDVDGSPFTESQQYMEIDFRQLTQEVRLNGNFGDFAEYTIGGFYLDTKGKDREHIDAPIFPDFSFNPPIPTNLYTNDRTQAHTEAGFAHLVVHPLAGLTVTGGLRYTREYKHHDYDRGVGQAATGKAETYRGSRWDYRVAVDYQFTPQLMAYAQTATGFKGGGPNPRPIALIELEPGSPYRTFKPETLTSYEAGVKTTFLDRRVRLNIAGFISKYKDMQIQANNCPDPDTGAFNFCFAQLNAGDATIKGLEFETLMQPLPGLTIDGSLSYLYFQYTRVNPLTGFTKSNVAPNSPDWKWSFGIQYEIPVGSGTLTPRFDGSYQAPSFSYGNNAPSTRIPSFSVFNARLTYRAEAGAWEASLQATNLFDKYYILNHFDQQANLLGYTAAQVAPPRRVALTLKYNFGQR